jgi:aminomethyltransferase
MNAPNGKKTPLAPLQEASGARFVDFGGWDLPVLYTGIVEETEAVRSSCGLFDVSHMGRFFASGYGAQEALDAIFTRDLSTLQTGRQRYSLLLQEDGGIIDDLMIARVGDQEFLLVVNAGNREADWDWIELHLDTGTTLIDRSDETLMLALQGPQAEKILVEATGCDTEETRFLQLLEGSFEGTPFLASRSGYTGEDGFEIIIPVDAGVVLWQELTKRGAKPCGLGARDLLRLEVAYPLYGHELSREIRPADCGLEWTLSRKNPYIGIEAAESTPPRYDLIGLVCEEKSIPRAEYPVEVGGKQVGHVTSGGLSSRLPNGFGLARVEKDSVQDSLDVVIRGKRIPAKKVATPFIRDHVKR